LKKGARSGGATLICNGSRLKSAVLAFDANSGSQ